MTYPATFRKKVLSIMESKGLSLAESAERFGVGIASIVRWKKHPEPTLKRNKPATKIDMDALAKDIAENPDSFLHERAVKFSVSLSGMGSAVKRLGCSRKKSLQHPKADPQVRAVFEEKIKNYEQQEKPMVYSDESGFAHKTTRTHGYATVGKRCLGVFNWRAKGRTNAIGALLGGILMTVCLFQTNINANIFHSWVVYDLLSK